MPNGGFRMVANALETYGYEPDPQLVETFTKYRKTHNAAVFHAYTEDIRNCRSSHILTGLPDAYGRGRIIGDYRRVAVYGIARLIERRQEERRSLDGMIDGRDHARPGRTQRTDPRARGIEKMAVNYGFDISVPARTSREAVQWPYFAYLAAVKEQNRAAMSLGRTSTFLDIYFERDLASGAITEQQAQEIIDDFVINLRIVRFLRTPAGYAQAALLAPLCPGAGTNRRRRRYFADRTFAAGLGNIERVDVLSFHQMGRFKWEELAHEYALHNTKPPTHELVQRVCGQFAAEGLKVY